VEGQLLVFHALDVGVVDFLLGNDLLQLGLFLLRVHDLLLCDARVARGCTHTNGGRASKWIKRGEGAVERGAQFRSPPSPPLPRHQ